MTFNAADYDIQRYRAAKYRTGKATDLVAICDDLGVEVYVQEFTDNKLSGLIEKKGNIWSIFVDAKDPLVRQRFTIAHELGHYFSYMAGKLSKEPLDHTGELEDRAYLTRPSEATVHDPIETEANKIAAELLMPEDVITAMMELGDTTDEMAEKLGVSASALGFRLQYLGHLPLESILS